MPGNLNDSIVNSCQTLHPQFIYFDIFIQDISIRFYVNYTICIMQLMLTIVRIDHILYISNIQICLMKWNFGISNNV